jgi:sugar lactone lactonase YvrE
MAIKVSGNTVIDSNRNATVNTLTLDGTAITATAAELNTLDGVTATVDDLNKLDGAVATTQEINYLSGVTSSIQTQLDSISVTAGSLTKSFASGETASIALSSALSPAPVVSVTKEVPQTGIISKGAWDVASSGANYDRLDTAYDTTLTPFSEGWDISTASFLQSFYIGSQESSSTGVFFKTDGTKMYVIGWSGDDVNEYDLSTAWDVSTASFLQRFYIGSQDTNPNDMFFKPDGTKMYIVGDAGNDINEYNLSTAWNVSTASYSQNFSVGSQESNPSGMFFKPDGTKMYILGDAGNDINEYDLSTAWDISTASYSQNFNVGSQEGNPTCVFFKPDGTKMYILGYSGDYVNEYSLSTAWDVSTASYSQNFYVAYQDVAPHGLFFKPDGTKMYVTGQGSSNVHEYDLDLTQTLILGTGSFASSDIGKTIEGNGGAVVLTATDGSYVETTAFTDSSTIAAGDWSMTAVTANATDGLEMSSAAENTWDLSTAVYTTLFYVNPQETAPQGIFFKPDGLKMFVTGTSGDDVNEYNLSTAWDVSSSVYSQNFSVSSQDSFPRDVFFKPDGLKMFIMGDTGNSVYVYSLSTAWDISTASYSNQTLNVGGSGTGQDANPFSIFFHPDGTTMYYLGLNYAYVNAWSLSTAWDVSTASYSTRFYVGSQDSTPRGLFFKPDGKKMYVCGQAGNEINEYSLGAAWDVSTASYSTLLSVASQDGSPNNIFFHPDGVKMYMVGDDYNQVYEYNLGTFVSATGYIPSITNAGGQIDTEYWTDINSMTTDDIAGAGAAYYAVSTDDRTTWSVIKEADGVRPIVRDNGGTWQYNSAISVANAWDISTAVFNNKNFSFTSQASSMRTGFFKPDGTKMYMVSISTHTVYEYNLSTAWDVSTSVYSTNSKDISGQETASSGLFFKTDGTKMYLCGKSGDDVNEYNLSTAWDVSTASYSQSFSVSGQETNPSGLFFRADGLKMYVAGATGDDVNEYTLSTAWDVSTASYVQTFGFSSQDTDVGGIFFKPDGLKMFHLGDQNNNAYEYTLTTAWDVSTASYTQSFSVATEEIYPKAISFKSDGSKMFVFGEQGNDVSEYDIGSVGYTTSTTWANSTTNSELYALQQALTEVAPNRMDKTQLEAVTDPNHYTLGDSLDLMIGLYLGSASSDVPSSDGVSINYDAESLNKGAILGTDYDYDFPDSTTVRVTSNAAQNLKVRVV